MKDHSTTALTRSVLQDGLGKLELNIEVSIGTVLEADRRYEIVARIGAGGMGAVYIAKVLDAEAVANGEIEREVAIKVFSTDTQLPDQLERREIGMLKALRHPYIVTMYDTGNIGDNRFAVIQYCSKGSVQDRLLAGERFTPAEALQILLHMLSALVGTHSCGILHLDIKPANILINDEGDYLLSDFGAARTLFQQNQRYLMGTPFFMSPEQARAEMDLLDARSDLFSLAATLWLLLYPEEKVNFKYSDLQARRKTESLPSLAAVLPEQDQRMARLIDRMLAFTPRDRPGSVAEALIEAHMIAGADDDDAPQLAAAVIGEPLEESLRLKLKNYMSDPIILELLTGSGKFYQLQMYEHGDLICVEDSLTYDVFILLHGKIEVIRGGRLLFEERDEGTILGEVSALAGHPRTATLRAHGDVILAVMNASELEQAARRMPALSVRIMKNLARRVIERDRFEG